MITERLKKAIATVILTSMISTASIYTPHHFFTVHAAEIKGQLTVEAGSLWTYSQADWNARTKIVNNGEKFTLQEKIIVDGREMYGLTNGLFITANPQYVSASEENVTPPVHSEKETKVILENLNLRTGIGSSYAIITTMPKGAQVVVLQTSEGWSQVDYNGTIGWASSAYLGDQVDEPEKDSALPAPSSMKTTTDSLSMRVGPATSYDRILIIPKGAQVESISSSNGWDQIVYQGKTGYSATSYLTANQEPPKVEAPVVIKKVTTYNLCLRQGPSTSTERILVIPKGSQVESLSSANGWDQVTYQGTTGYASSAYLTVGSAEIEKPLITIKTTMANLYMRQGPATSYKSILTIPKGSKVESASSENGWDFITYSGKTGYASSKYLTTDPIESIKVTGEDIITYGKTFLGIPYTWGGNNPTEGFDCSGLVKYIYANFGVQTPRVSYQQAVYGREVSLNNLQLGDILYFGNSEVSHVALYAGNNTMLHAPRPGQFVEIRDASWHLNNYQIVGARRYLD